MAKVTFTAGRVAGFRCPADKLQAFMWDAAAPGLGLRATPAGRPAYVFQGRYQGKVVRVTIGGTEAWTIADAQAKARALQRLIDEGKDPRGLKRDAIAAAEAKNADLASQAEAEKREALTVGEVWQLYLEDRKPFWGERHYADHVKMAKAGGEVSKRGVKLAPDGTKPKTMPGPIFQLLSLPLRDLTPTVVEQWAAAQAKTRPTYARLCWRCLKVFLNWCAENPEFSGLLSSSNPAKTKKAREVLGKPSTAYFSDRGRPFQADRGRRFRPSWTRKKMRASGESNVSQSSTISLKRLSCWLPPGSVFGYPSLSSGPCQAAGGAPRCFILWVAQ